MSVREDRLEGAKELDELSEALAKATRLAGRGLISSDLTKRLGQFSEEVAQASHRLTQTHSGVVVQLGKPNRRAPQAKSA